VPVERATKRRNVEAGPVLPARLHKAHGKNGLAESWIVSVRRELLDHIVAPASPLAATPHVALHHDPPDVLGYQLVLVLVIQRRAATPDDYAVFRLFAPKPSPRSLQAQNVHCRDIKV
jgi:hypothetical protein